MKRKLEKGSVDVTLKDCDHHLGDLDVVTVPGGAVLRLWASDQGSHGRRPVRIVWGYANYSAGYIVEQDEYGKGLRACKTPFPRECGAVCETDNRRFARKAYGRFVISSHSWMARG